MRNISLFDSFEDERRTHDWVPDTPPLIKSKGIRNIRLNFETSGLEWFRKDRPISATVMLPDGSIYFLPWGFRGGNLDPEVMLRWGREELRDVHIENINTRFEVHMSRAWGVDLEAQGCTVSDVAHWAALLDDHRQQFSLDVLATDFLGGPRVPRIDETRMTEYHAAEAAPRARHQLELVKELHDVFWPRIVAEDLERVAKLESEVIYPVCEMEKNGALIDVELLDRWLIESQKKYEEYLWELIKLTGFQTDPGRKEHRERLFQWAKIPLQYLPSGRASFTDEIMKGIEHPAIVLLRKAIKISSLRSKYLVKYRKNVDSNGLIRYSLHQLRSQKDPYSDYESSGTITGRFSCTAMRGNDGEDIGINVQQEMKAAKQRVAFGYDEDDDSYDDEIFVIRKLRIPEKGKKHLSSDAMQMEYRIFASYWGDPAVLKAYRENPLLKFHDYMYERIAPHITRAVWTYRDQKDTNFAYIYGAKLLKLALMLGHISKQEYNDIKRKKLWDHPKLEPTKEVQQIYRRELPGVDALLEEASHLAKPACDEHCYNRYGKLKNPELHARLQHRGYVKTILGRRSRFPDGQRLHKGFNSVDQGSGADILKQKAVELHRERKYTGLTLRYTVHDEFDGDAPDEECGRRVHEVLNTQSFPQLKVPIMWEVAMGDNWADCKERDEFASSDRIKMILGIHDQQEEIR